VTPDRKPASGSRARPPRKPKGVNPGPEDPKAAETVVEAGPVAVQMDAGKVAVVVAAPAPAGIDRRLFRLINELPHTTTSDRYVSVLSDLGEGLGWVAGGAVLAILGGPKGRRAGLAVAAASLSATYVVQQRVKPLFRRVRPFVNREAHVVGLRPPDHSFQSGHTASSFAAATALAFFYPRAAPLAYTLATGVGVSRVHLGVHFPSDAAVGGVIGIGIGTFSAWLFKPRGRRGRRS
jgi:membrane-associated phospholipid phosphatase